MPASAHDSGEQNVCPEPDWGGTTAGTPACVDGRCTIAEGPFWQGGADPRFDSACPARTVFLSAFVIDQREVSRARFDACVTAGACEPAEQACLDRVEASPGSDLQELPSSCVTLYQAQALCEFEGGRLPTEAEWEKAVRGTDGARWPHGSTAPTCSEANFRFASSYCHLGPLPSGSLPAGQSPFGLYDGAGNVWEWTADAFDASWYDRAPDTDPAGPDSCRESRNRPPGPCDLQVIRGGSYLTVEFTTQPWVRNLAPPDTIDESIGFRCAWDR